MNAPLLITPFQKGYEADIQQVFYSSVHNICRQDYTQQQLEIWTKKSADLALWTEKIQRLQPYIAFKDNRVYGYADIQANGYIDHFYVHSDYQSQGIGTALIKTLLQMGEGYERIFSHVSVTAKSFFMQHGFVCVQENTVRIQGCDFINYVMEYKR